LAPPGKFSADALAYIGRPTWEERITRTLLWPNSIELPCWISTIKLVFWQDYNNLCSASTI